MKKVSSKQIFASALKIISTYPVIGIFILFFAIFTILFPDRFLTPLNISSMIRQFVTLMLFSIGPSMVMSMGSLDLSFVGIWMFGSVLVWMLTPFLGLGAILAYPILGLVTGLVIGVIQVKAKIPSFILTLSVLISYWGLTALLAGGQPRSIRGFEFITTSIIQGVPTVIFWAIPIILVAIFLVKRTVIGTYLYAIGSNQEGAYLAGIDVSKYRILAFVLSGLFTGIGSIILFQHLGGSVPVELHLGTMNTPLVAIILGGTPLMGGKGGPHRTILGAITLTVLVRGLNIAMLEPELIELLMGLMLIVSIIVGSRCLDKGGVEVS